jgi:trehalose 6-phosphate phosphatase
VIYALNRQSKKQLREWIRLNRVLFAFDFDGTLAVQKLDPGAAKLSRKTATRLLQIAKNNYCAVITGRRRGDALDRIPVSKNIFVIGNHGSEGLPLKSLGGFARRVQRWTNILEQTLSGSWRGFLEDKTFSISLHYRSEVERRQAMRVVKNKLRGVRCFGGKHVINLVPRGAPNKGDAVMALSQKLGCNAVLFMGDDITDEDVFRLDRGPFPGRNNMYTVRVANSKKSKARFYLRSQGQVDEFLKEILISLR